ncbi:MAG: retention module-containing protein, partial [Citrobacter sp.]
MAAQTVLVTKLTGQAWIRDTDGNLTVIHEGMRIPADAKIITASGSSVELQADGQPPLIVGENQDVSLTADLLQPPQPEEAAIASPANSQIDQIIAAINAGQDPFDNIDPTAAGLTGGSEGGSTFVRLSSIIEAVSPLDLAYPRITTPVPELPRYGGVAEPEGAAPSELRPQAQADVGRVFEDGAQLRGNVLGNDQLGQGTAAQHSTALNGSGQGQYGVVTLNADGSYAYVLNNQLHAVQSLAVGETLTETYTYTVTDAAGNTSSSTLTITVVGTNDIPGMAGDLNANVKEDSVLSAQGQLTVSDVDASDTHKWTVENGQGKYGKFEIDQNGKWTYTLDNSNPLVQALGEGEQREERFEVIVDDGHGGIDIKTVVVIVTGTADSAKVEVNLGADDTAGRVYEHGLVMGDESRITSGQVTVKATDGIKSVTIGGTTHGVDDWVGQSITTQGGSTLVITAARPDDDGGVVLNYTYTLNHAQTNDPDQSSPESYTLTDTIGVTVQGVGGSSANGNIVITIVDDVPVATDDVASITADGTSAAGNVITGTADGAGKDVKGADGATVTQVKFGSTLADVPVDGTKATIVGQYGTLTIQADGSYSYVRHAGSAGGKSDVFTYTLKDGDGDSDTATLSISIGNSTPEITNVPDAGSDGTSVSEAGLVGGSAAGNGSNATSGTIGFTSKDGVSEVLLGGKSVTSTDATKPTDLGDGLKAYYSFDAVTGTGTIHYSYTLQGTTVGDNTGKDFAIVVKDADGEPSTAGKLRIDIVDDEPKANADVAS